MTAGSNLQKALKRAWLAHEADDHDDVVCILCEALEREFNRRLPQVLGVALGQHPWPEVGVRCVQAAMEIRIERTRDRYAGQHSLRLLHYADAICSTMPAMAPVERMCMTIHRVMRACLSGRTLLPLRRVMLSCLQPGYRLLLRCEPRAREQMRVLSEILSTLLSEPEQQSQAILREHQDCMRLTLTHNIWRHGDGSSASCLAAFHWPERAAYRRLIGGRATSRVLTTIHMGDFSGAFNCLATQADPGWQALTIVRERDEQHVAAPEVASMRQRVLRPGQYSATEIISSLRRGGHTLCILFDLREGFGGTVEVSFFGHRARIVKGPAALAIAGGAPIIPFVTFQENGVHHLEMAGVIDTRLHQGEGFEAGVARITQQLAGLAEKWIRRFPAQWKFLPQLPLYFDFEPERP